MTEDKKIHRLVKEIADMAEHASLTGSLETGKSTLVKRYNSIVAALEGDNGAPYGLFGKLPDDADFAQIVVEARLLYAYLKDNNENGSGSKHGDLGVVLRLAPFVNSQDLSEMIKVYMAKGCDVDERTLTALAPFLESGMLGELVRDLVAKSKGGAGVVVVDARKTDEASSPVTPETPATPVAPAHAEAVVGDQDLIDQLTDELMRDDIPTDTRRALVEQLKRLTKKASSLPE